MFSVNTIWILLCGAMVIFMQAGFAMLETGFTRSKNAGNIVMKNIMDICIGAPLFIIFGFGLMHGNGNGIIGKLDLMLQGDYSSILPEGVSLYAYIFFQLAFCATAATIVSGAMAERTKFSAYCVYSAVISTLVFPVIGHWIWGNGWLSQMGFHDFAGGTVVHTVGGMSALVGAWLLGPRIGKYTKNGESKAIPGHNITLGALGVLILWFGWYGFNGGSALFMEGDKVELAGKIFLNTTMAATVSAVTAMITSKLKYKKTDVSMSVNGLLAGLVAITAGCDKVNILGAVTIGAFAGIILVNAIDIIDKKLKVDDPVGAIAAHGVSGIFGTCMVGLLATDKGLFYTGNSEFFGVQCLGSVSVAAVTAIVMFIVFRLIDITVGLRVDAVVEIEGIDSHEHGLKSAYGDFLIHNYLGEAERRELEKLTLEMAENKMSNEPADSAEVSVDEAIPIEKLPETGSGNPVLSKVEIIIRQSKFEVLKEAMNQIGITGMTVTQVLGCGVQKGMSEYYRGSRVDMQLLPKIKVEIVVAKVPVDLVIETARKVLYTGHIGDGKIFVYDIRNAVKIRTGAKGYDAMQGLQD